MVSEANGQEALPFQLSGSQRKTAFALRYNAGKMIEAAGVERIVFATLTLGERDQFGEWMKVHDGKEASRRLNNLARRVLPALYEKWIIVSERHKDGGIHFHLLAVARCDVRTGFDFAAVEDGDYSSASDGLRGIWSVMRGEEVEAMGFGRCEAMPVRSTGEAIAAYCSKYIEKNICYRLASDRRQKLVRYHGFGRRHLKANDFHWASPKACEWRRKARAIAAAAKLWETEQVRASIGPRWAFRINRAMFDLQLPIDTDWWDGQMTRDQEELARDWMERDARSWGGKALSEAGADKQREAWERALTAAEWEELQRDLKYHEMRVEAEDRWVEPSPPNVLSEFSRSHHERAALVNDVETCGLFASKP